MEPYIDRFAQHFKVIVPDLRGHGWSTNPSGTFTHSQSAMDVLALLDSLGIGRFSAMGISSGGMTLVHIATRQPDRVGAMVLIGTTSYFPEQARVIMRMQTVASQTPRQWEYIRRCAKRGDVQARQLVEQFHAFKDSYDDMNFTPPYLGRITARTLIIHGDRDAFFPVDIPVGMYQSIPDAALWIVPGGGHIPISGSRALHFQDVALNFLQP